jgi:hypothetical protein
MQLTNMGKKTKIADMTIFGCSPYPNHTTMSGAIAIFGKALKA